MPTDNELKIAVVDDIEQDRVQIAEQTRDILCQAKILHSISGYADGKSLLDDLRSGKKYSLLLLDVMMDEMDGMELADELHRQGNHTTIIFISINREMALYGYERDAVRYLAKPLEKAKLEEALMHCCTLWQEKKKSCCQPTRVSTGSLFLIFNSWKPLTVEQDSILMAKQWRAA